MSPPRVPPVLQLDGSLTRETLDGLLPSIASVALPSFLPTRRWFGHKQWRIANVGAEDWAIGSGEDVLFALLIVGIDFDDAPSADYFTPLSVSREAVSPEATVATLDTRDQQVAIVDAPTSPPFRTWLAGEIARGSATPARRGQFVWERVGDARSEARVGDAARSRVVSGEQSNTSIVYGDSMIVKILRRAEIGLNPDVELGRFLTERTAFRHAPRLFGDLRYAGDDGSERSLGVAQEFVASIGDGWSYMLDALTAAPHDADGLIPQARLLGQRTAEMHVALAGESSDPALRPDPIGDVDIERWSRELASTVTRVDRSLASSTANMSTPLVELTRAFRGRVAGLSTRFAGLEHLLGLSKTRVHGDYHLGQTLRTRDEDWVILDFEGEPQRSLAERRQKTTPLKDVAGMLRSFAYLRGTAERTRHVADCNPRRDWGTWENALRDAFLDGYFGAAAAGRAAFLPSPYDRFRAAIVPWELDKAMYEVEYELNNRPDWLWLPLAATLELS